MNKVEYGLSKRVLQLATRSYRNGISLCEGLNPGLYEQIEFKYAYLLCIFLKPGVSQIV